MRIKSKIILILFLFVTQIAFINAQDTLQATKVVTDELESIKKGEFTSFQKEYKAFVNSYSKWFPALNLNEVDSIVKIELPQYVKWVNDSLTNTSYQHDSDSVNSTISRIRFQFILKHFKAYAEVSKRKKCDCRGYEKGGFKSVDVFGNEFAWIERGGGIQRELNIQKEIDYDKTVSLIPSLGVYNFED